MSERPTFAQWREQHGCRGDRAWRGLWYEVRMLAAETMLWMAFELAPAQGEGLAMIQKIGEYAAETKRVRE